VVVALLQHWAVVSQAAVLTQFFHLLHLRVVAAEQRPLVTHHQVLMAATVAQVVVVRRLAAQQQAAVAVLVDKATTVAVQQLRVVPAMIKVLAVALAALVCREQLQVQEKLAALDCLRQSRVRL
jgi:cell envelope opacity-associated protein A